MLFYVVEEYVLIVILSGIFNMEITVNVPCFCFLFEGCEGYTTRTLYLFK